MVYIHQFGHSPSKYCHEVMYAPHVLLGLLSASSFAYLDSRLLKARSDSSSPVNLSNGSKSSEKFMGFYFPMELWSPVCLIPLTKVARTISKEHSSIKSFSLLKHFSKLQSNSPMVYLTLRRDTTLFFMVFLVVNY